MRMSECFIEDHFLRIVEISDDEYIYKYGGDRKMGYNTHGWSPAYGI